MKFIIQIISIAALTFGARCAHAGNSAQELLSACRPIANAPVRETKVQFDPSYETGFCWGTFQAIQKVVIYVDSANRPFVHVCAPPQSTTSQLVAVFVAYAEKRPARLHEHGFDIALESLQSAFPCKK